MLFSVRHLYKDCSLMWQFLYGGCNKGEHEKDLAPTADDTEEKDDDFATLDGYLLIFRGSVA